ncbi:hypothetical protein Tco_1239951 [Tanacetum coccineum]
MYGFKECSSCGAWYNKLCGCSKGGFVDKFVRDLNKTPDSSQRPLIFEKNCPKCGDPVEGLYCRQCALIRKKLEEVFQDFQDTSESSNDNPNVINVPQEPFVLNQDPGENPSQSPPRAHYGYNCPPKKIPIYYDNDDDEESSIPLRDIIISGLPPCIAITPVLTTKEPVDSLIMEDEHLGTISAMESDEFIKFSAENLVPTPSESEDASDGVCDLPVCDDFPKSHLFTFSNPLFDIDDDCTSSDDESFSEEDVPMENLIFFSNSLFDLDEEIVSTEVNLIQNEIDSLLDEFAGELTFLKSIPPGIDDDNLDPEGEIHLVERLLYDNSSPRPPEELNV